jgi:hypothetical protein
VQVGVVVGGAEVEDELLVTVSVSVWPSVVGCWPWFWFWRQLHY